MKSTKTFKTMFTNYFKPSMYISDFTKININSLKIMGIKWLFCDLDNTLVPHYQKFPSDNVMKFLVKLKKSGIKIIVVSNNIKSRVKLFCEKANITNYIYNTQKPFIRKMKKFMQNNNIRNDEALMLGDQILLDIWVANRLKILSILVQPMVSVDFKKTKFNVFIENQIYKRLERTKALKRGQFENGNLGIKHEVL